MIIITNTLNKFIIFTALTLIFTACGPVTPYVSEPINVSTAKVPSTFTPSPIPMLEPTNTISPIGNYLQKIEGLSEKCQPISEFYDEHRSADVEWIVYDCRENLELFIIKHDGSKAWQVGYEQFSNYKKTPDGMSRIHWSSDSRYVYFEPTHGCCWDPLIAFLGQPLDEVWQFDVVTGAYANIMIGFDYVSFSPNDKTVLLIPQMRPSPIISVYDLQSHEVMRDIKLNGFASAGDVVWATSGQQFGVLTASGGDFEYYKEGDKYIDAVYSVIIVDLNTFSQRVIISESKKVIDLTEITDANILLFSSYEYQADGLVLETDGQYDLASKQFLASTPSP